MKAAKNKLKGSSPGELGKLLAEKREELRALRFVAAGARPKDSTASRKTRKDIARILTELSERGGSASLGRAIA